MRISPSEVNLSRREELYLGCLREAGIEWRDSVYQRLWLGRAEMWQTYLADHYRYEMTRAELDDHIDELRAYASNDAAWLAVVEIAERVAKERAEAGR